MKTKIEYLLKMNNMVFGLSERWQDIHPPHAHTCAYRMKVFQNSFLLFTMESAEHEAFEHFEKEPVESTYNAVYGYV